MSITTTSDQILERLHQWGVRRVFGYPGDGINGLLGAFDRIGERMQFVQARHEELRSRADRVARLPEARTRSGQRAAADQDRGPLRMSAAASAPPVSDQPVVVQHPRRNLHRPEPPAPIPTQPPGTPAPTAPPVEEERGPVPPVKQPGPPPVPQRVR